VKASLIEQASSRKFIENSEAELRNFCSYQTSLDRAKKFLIKNRSRDRNAIKMSKTFLALIQPSTTSETSSRFSLLGKQENFSKKPFVLRLSLFNPISSQISLY
jgi:hypothetical protein